MPEMYDVLVKVISVKGYCLNGNKVGDEWVFSSKSPEGLCLGALDSLLTSVIVLSSGGSYPWETDPEAATIACPDPKNSVVFELRRLPK